MSAKADFPTRYAAISKNAAAESEASILTLVQSGISANLPPQAAALARDWLRQNTPKNPTLLYHAARATELSGDAAAAAALYQQFLRQADPATPEASDAITAVHTLLAQYLAQPDFAYSFAAANLDRLIANPQFRQWDTWFLAEARRRGDAENLANRLLAIVKAGTPPDAIIARHDQDLDWLLNHIRTRRYDIPENRIPATLATTITSLAQALTPTDPEYAQLLHLTTAIRHYNMARLDGKELAPPLAEAKTLLEKFPQHALLIQTEWAGGSTSQHYRADTKKYFPHQAEEKIAPILAALPKLDPIAQTLLIQSWSPGHYASGPEIIPVEKLTEIILQNPKLINTPAGPSLNLDWAKIPEENLPALATVLAQNPSPAAALIHARIAAGPDKDLAKAVDTLLTTHAWRLTPTELHSHADRLWHATGKPDGSQRRDQEIARAKQLADTITTANPPPNAPLDQRLLNIRALLNDLKSNNPKTPGALWRIRQALVTTPEAAPELLRDPSPIAALLIRETIAKLDPPSALALEPDLRTRLAQQLAQSTIDPWLATTWLTRKFPQPIPAEPLELLAKLTTSPAWQKLPTSIHRAARTTFGEAALTPSQLTHTKAADPQHLCAPLLALTETSDPAAVAAAVKESLANLSASPVRRDIIGLENIPTATIKDPATLAQLIEIAHPFRSFNPVPQFGSPFFAALRENPNPAHLIPAAAYLWRHAEIHHREYGLMIQFITTIAESQPASTITLAAWTRATIARFAGGHTYFNREDLTAIDALRGRALTQLGLITIPVPPDHPAYPVYQAQAEWIIGNEDTAWKSLDTHWDTFLQNYRSLNPTFLLWALELTVTSAIQDRQEAFLTPIVTWANEPKSPFSTDEKARIDIALADVALQRGQLTQAEQIFTRVQNNDAIQESNIRHTAALRRIRSHLAGNDHDGALELIANLEADRIPGLWIPLRLARAEVFYAMERFDDAHDDVHSVLQRQPENPDALLLMGRIQIKNRRYLEASSLEIGATTESPYLVPGENLKVTLNDPGLTISGSGTDIEVVVTSSSGDTETFFLRRFGDEKTRFRGELSTALGAPTPGDSILQVTGDDQIFYAYSEDFRKRINLTEEMRGGPITVASDATLMASARQLLTPAEQRIADLESEISTSENNRLADLDPSTRARLAATSDTSTVTRAQATVVKPGNPVHVRVIDLDRSRSTSPDQLTISAATSSGDSISRITLTETGPNTGWFEASIPTASSPPSAFATNTEPGRNPNSVISPLPDSPPWQPVATANAVHEFFIDLNDRASLGQFTLTTPANDGRIKHLVIQTATRHGAWQTIARHPATNTVPANPWQPHTITVRQQGDNLLRNALHHGTKLETLQALLDNEQWLRDADPIATATNVPDIATAFPADTPERLNRKDRDKWQTLGLVHRFTAYFHEPEITTRHFQINLGNPTPTEPYFVHKNQLTQKTGFFLTINRRPIAETHTKTLEGEITLTPGIHRLEIWAVGWSPNFGFGRTPSLRANLDPENPDKLIACPPAFFDPATFPPALLEPRNAPATITANPSGDTLTATFAPDTQARLIRLLIPAYQGPTPAINRITLNAKDGSQILPTSTDHAKLRQNETLEILPNDTVSIRYSDDRPVTRGRDQHERFLRAAFTDGILEFADIEPRFSEKHGKIRPYRESLLRFNHNEPLSIVITDGDMDTTPNPDTLTVTLQADGASPQQFTATETGPATAIFRLLVTPTPDSPTAQNQFQIPPGGTLAVTYLDRENTRPGVPTERIATISHAQYKTPEIHLAHSTVQPLAEPAPHLPLIHGFDLITPTAESTRRTPELVQPRWQIQHQWINSATPPQSPIQTPHGKPIAVKIHAPHLIPRAGAQIQVYAQTSSGRRAAGPAANNSFDINTPGTIELTAVPRSSGNLKSLQNPGGPIPEIPIYQSTEPIIPPDLHNIDDLFAIIPVVADALPNYGVVTPEERQEMIRQASDSRSFVAPTTNRNALVVKPGDTIHIGIQSTDPAGNTSWITSSADIITHPAFDIMEDGFLETKTAAYIGETLYLRTIDLGADTSDNPDTLEVLIQAKSGAKSRITLTETGPHTGIFTARPFLTYTANPAPLPEDYDLRTLGLPVTYGDTVAARYTASNGLQTDIATLSISKGANGALTPFSKTFDDPDIAVRTQFSLAEAHLELARRYRQLKENTLADQNATTASQLLAAVAHQFTDPDARAHAEYLLGQLTLQEALVTQDPPTKELRFRAALSRFMTVTSSFPDTLHAANAQFRIATIYEALGENDVAAQEYVKLAYKYPESEFLATSMARLGTHFLRRSAAYEEESKTLLAKAQSDGDKDAEYRGTAMAKMAQREYLNTARIFSRLSERFPSHELAADAGLRAGQAYMRATQHRDAVNTFLRVADNPAYDGPEIRAQAMYWAAMNYIPLRETMAAFAMFQRVTYDFPESQWAAFARGQLSQENMLKLETQLELQRLEQQ